MAAQTASNAAAVTFPKATGAGTTLTHFGIGTAETGDGKLLYSDALANSIPITANVTQPVFAIGALTIAITGDVTDLLTELWLKHLLQNAAIAGVGDAGGLQPSASAGNLYVSLHTASPDAADIQTTSEADYTSYARVAVVRSASGWTVA